MADNSDRHLRRRSVLGAIGATSAVCTIPSTKATSRSDSTDERSGHGTNTVSIDVTPLGDVDPVEIIPRQAQLLGDSQRRPITEAASNGRATMSGEPTFSLGSILQVGDRYYQVSATPSGETREKVPTLDAKPIEAELMEQRRVRSLDSFDEPARRFIRDAVAKARYLAARAERRPEATHRDSVTTDSTYVINPNEPVPTELSSHRRPFAVSDQNEYYQVRYEEQSATVPTFNVEMAEVADSPRAFNDWFTDERVIVEESTSVMSASERQLFSKAKTGVYRENSPYSGPVQSFFNRLEVNVGSSSRSNRYLRIDDTLHYVEVSQGVGC